MRIDFNKVHEEETLDYTGDLSYFNSLKSISTIKEYKKVTGKITLEKADSVLIVHYLLKPVLTVYSTLSGEPFDYIFTIDEKLYYTDQKELDSEEVFYIKEGYIDLNVEIYSLIITSLPMVLHKDGEEYPHGDNYRVLSEDELDKEVDDSKFSPFDKLKDLDLD